MISITEVLVFSREQVFGYPLRFHFDGGKNVKRIQYYRYGGPEEMRLEEVSVPDPEGSEILVEMKATAVNPVDWKKRRGSLKFVTGNVFPKGMGLDFSGVIKKKGPEVSGLEVGDAVIGALHYRQPGSYAEAFLVSSKKVTKMPNALSFEQAACLPTAGATAWISLVVHGKIKSGDRVFVGGCAGGVGQAAVQIAKHYGARVAGNCGPQSIAFARSMGVEPVLDYRTDKLSSLREKYDIVLDTSGKLSTKEMFSILAPGGVVVDINPTFFKLVKALFSKRLKLAYGDPQPKIIEQLADLAAQGKLTFSIGRTAHLSEAQALLAELEQGPHGPGKAVILNP